MTTQWRVRYTLPAQKQVDAINDRRIQRSILDRIDGLVYEPEKQGKPLEDDLAGYRSVRAVGQRYRVIYRIEESIVTVLVVTLGIRKEGSKLDVYAVAEKLARLGLLEPEKESPLAHIPYLFLRENEYFRLQLMSELLLK